MPIPPHPLGCLSFCSSRFVPARRLCGAVSKPSAAATAWESCRPQAQGMADGRCRRRPKLRPRFPNKRTHAGTWTEDVRAAGEEGVRERTRAPPCAEGSREPRQAQSGVGAGGGPQERLLNSVLVASSPQQSHPMTTHVPFPPSSVLVPVGPSGSSRAGCTRAARVPGRWNRLFPLRALPGLLL